MAHASDALLRRLDDEPFAVPDATFEHVMRCDRCRGRREGIAADASFAARLLGGPQLVADVDEGWRQLCDQLDSSRPGDGSTRAFGRVPGRTRRTARVPARAAVAIGAAGLVLTGAAAAATVKGVFAPTHVAPVPVTPADVHALTGLIRLADSGPLSGFATPSGTGSLPFGTLRWTSPRPANQVSTPAEAQAVTGIPVPLPGRVPPGVGEIDRVMVQPELTATVTFDARAGDLADATVEVNAGPAVFVGYGSGAGGLDVPTLGVVTMRRPTASTTGATIDQVTSFLLAQPGVPPGLAEQLRLLGDLSTVLPVPAPEGTTSKSVTVGDRPGVLIADPSGAATGVVWQDDAHLVHAVAGLVDQEHVLDVADQLR